VPPLGEQMLDYRLHVQLRVHLDELLRLLVHNLLQLMQLQIVILLLSLLHVVIELLDDVFSEALHVFLLLTLSGLHLRVRPPHLPREPLPLKLLHWPPFQIHIGLVLVRVSFPKVLQSVMLHRAALSSFAHGVPPRPILCEIEEIVFERRFEDLVAA